MSKPLRLALERLNPATRNREEWKGWDLQIEQWDEAELAWAERIIRAERARRSEQLASGK